MEEILENILKTGPFLRLGKTFCTEKSNYFYDTGTGKIIECDRNVFDILKTLETYNNVDKVKDLGIQPKQMEEAVSDIKEAYEMLHLFQAPYFKAFLAPHIDEIATFACGKINQLILEVTERCNLRCDYCIYGEDNATFRNFGQNDMRWQIAKKAIDYALENSEKELAVTFYGGEPLLRFEFIKQCIEYIENNCKEKTITYNMTTNLVLMDQEKAKYFASLEDFAVTCSIDGPEEIQDAHRKFPDGQGSFRYAIAGLKNLVNAYGSERTRKKISFSIVVAQPYKKEQLNIVQNFLDSIEWLPKPINASATYAEYDTVRKTENIKLYKEEIKKAPSMFAWTFKNTKTPKEIAEGKLITSQQVMRRLYRIHFRKQQDIPSEGVHLNGCCIPGSRRLYVTVEGDFKPCERIGECPSIGNVENGFQPENIQKYYVNDYANKSLHYCNECWARNLCTICYCKCYSEKGLDLEKKLELCNIETMSWADMLKTYMEYLEEDNNAFEFLDNI